MTPEIVSTTAHPLTPEQQRSHNLALKLVVPLLVILALIVLPLYGLYDYSKVSGPSMLNTLKNGEYLLITRGLSNPSRGDIVILVLQYQDGTTEEIVKRIVALPGDRIQVRGDYAIVNGRAEPVSAGMIFQSTTDPSIDTTVAADHVFVMGDNRPVSDDSRYLGELPLSDIHGRVIAVWAPVGRMRLVR